MLHTYYTLNFTNHVICVVHILKEKKKCLLERLWEKDICFLELVKFVKFLQGQSNYLLYTGQNIEYTTLWQWLDWINYDKMSFFLRCTDKSAAPVACLQGFFAPSGSTECQECPVGSHCPSNSSEKHVPCSPGSYANETSLSRCLECPAGHFCQNPAESPVLCENGTYSTGNAANCTVCPPGFRYCLYSG